MDQFISDAELVDRALAGDRSANDLLIERHYKTAVSAAFTLLGDVDAANDCAQEAFLEAARRLHTLREKSKFGNWIYGISRQQAILIVRRQKRHREAMQTKTDESKSVIQVKSPQEQMGKMERLESVRKALGQVNEIYREVLVLKYIDGRSHDEIAKILSISMAAVDKRLMRGKDLLRESLRRWKDE
jgi:RNA polymerase sigma-70 factor (ECF subfamily)